MAVAIAVIAVVARLAFGVHLPTQGFGFVLTLVLTAVAMLSLGALVASVASTTRIAQGLGTLLFFPMMFFAGLWVPRQQMSGGLRHVSDSRRWAPRPQRSRTRCTATGPGWRTWRCSRATRSCFRSRPLGCFVGSRHSSENRAAIPSQFALVTERELRLLLPAVCDAGHRDRAGGRDRPPSTGKLLEDLSLAAVTAAWMALIHALRPQWHQRRR